MEIDIILLTTLLFILGLFIGSFLNVISDRLYRGETFIKGRSYCESCKHTLSFFDLFPVISFLFLGGKCRYCGKKLSWYYPFSELLTGMLFVAVYFAVGISSLTLLLFYVCIVSCMIIIFTSDLKYGIIPDKVVYPALVITLLFQAITNSPLLQEYILSALGSGSFFLLLFLVTKGRGMGFGDVKFAFFMGLLLGFPGIVYALYIAFLTAAFVSLILILWGKKHIKSTVPFGPFLVSGTLLVFLFPQYIDMLVKIILP